MIDCHCHFDMFQNPEKVINECESKRIVTIGMTNLPSHFEMGYRRIGGYKYIRLALGLHPLLANEHKNELNLFLKLIDKTAYIGEVGLDFSDEGIGTKEIQMESFSIILKELQKYKKIISLHSRKAEMEVLHYLQENKIKNAIFHWYSGSLQDIKKIIDCNYFFSINIAMIKSKHGQRIIREVPRNLLLTETDSPFTKYEGKSTKPEDVHYIIDYLSKLYEISYKATENLISSNFSLLIKQIR